MGAFLQNFKFQTTNNFDFWAWFVILNAIWILIPLIMLFQSISHFINLELSKAKKN